MSRHVHNEVYKVHNVRTFIFQIGILQTAIRLVFSRPVFPVSRPHRLGEVIRPSDKV